MTISKDRLFRPTILSALAAICLGFMLSSARADVSVATVLNSGLSEPYNVVVDADGNLFLTDAGNNRIVRVDASTQGELTLAGIPFDPPGSDDGPAFLAHFNNPGGLLIPSGLTNSTVTSYLGASDGLLVVDTGNNSVRFVRFYDGYVTTLAGHATAGSAVDAAGTNASFSSPTGLDQDGAGNVYIADSGNNKIRVLNINDPSFGVTNLVCDTTFLRPSAVTFVAPNILWVADTGNQMVKQITLTNSAGGHMTTALGTFRTTGTNDFLYGALARFNGPSGLLWVDGAGLLISDTLNNCIRLATNYTIFGATNYAVFTFAGVPGTTTAGLADGNALSAKFNQPFGISRDLFHNGFLVADLHNDAIRRIQTGPPLPPVPTPQIGWVSFVAPAPGDSPVSVLETSQPFVFNNDVIIAIQGTSGTETFYTSGPTPTNPLLDTVQNPSASVGSTPPPYENGVAPGLVPPTIVTPLPDLTVKAIGIQAGRQNSTIASARFVFKTATPTIIGDNAAGFTLTNQTQGAEMWYTTDGTDPTNGAPSSGPIVGSALISLDASTNLTFRVRGYKNNYSPSGVAAKTFSPSNFVANTISFGFASGEGSSGFQASPGQLFYAPVALSLLPATAIYSLQFNITVTNDGPNPGPIVSPGAFSFQSMLISEHDANYGVAPYVIPPLMFTNAGFSGTPFTNSALNLLGVGWFEEKNGTNLYNAKQQDLVAFSSAHDTLFTEASGKVIVGGYAFRVPSGAQAGQTYQIRLGRPSATSDGVGAPGSTVYISTPTNGSLGQGLVNSIKIVSIGQPKYLVGDCAPFRWFNAGDFGNTNLDNSDVMQVFESAVYQINAPPVGTDFLDSMDSAGGVYTNLNQGYLELNSTVPASLALLNGDDSTINQMAFGDGVLDVTDVYVTFRRSLDPSLTWFRRFWTNGARVAEIIPQTQRLRPPPASGGAKPKPTSLRPFVTFGAGDYMAAPGRSVTLPVTAQITGGYPLKVLMLNLSVVPLDGSPAIAGAIQFTPNPALGLPTLTLSKGVANYAATWLNSSIPGLSNNAVLGSVSFTIPAEATPNSAYALHFDHASASPNGIAPFASAAVSGLVTLSDRSSSSFNDGIPDSWRLRYFGSISNVYSAALADPDGDGANNWQEYLAGTDPTNPSSVLRLAATAAMANNSPAFLLQWPSVSGKQYILQRSSSLSLPEWLPVSTNAGTGALLQFRDDSGSAAGFYRVEVK